MSFAFAVKAYAMKLDKPKISTCSVVLGANVPASTACHQCNVATPDLCRCMQPLLILMLTGDVEEASCC